MHLVKLITADKLRRNGIAICMLLITQLSKAQENSPYSRYGIGDLVPAQNILNRAMGGISAGYADNQIINFANPASYGNLSSTVFDFGTQADVRTLKSLNPVKKFTNTNAIFSYLQLGVPIGSKRMAKKNMTMGLVFGLKPYSRINYKILKSERLLFPVNGSDSLATLFEGTGGTSQAYTGVGLRIKNFSVGANFGYLFGRKEISTRLIFINDTVDYYRSNSADFNTYGGLFVNIGMQYETKLKKGGLLRVGLYGNLQQKFNTSKDIIRETFVYDPNSNDNFRLDSVFEQKNIKGKLQMPMTVGGGFTYQGKQWLLGADVEMGNWASYRFNNEKDFTANNFAVRAGAEYLPARSTTLAKKYFSFVRYRAGFRYNTDYITNNGKNLKEYAFTFGAGFPLTSLRQFSSQFVTLNTAVELGSRTGGVNIKEGIARFSIGINMNARWFVKAKYD